MVPNSALGRAAIFFFMTMNSACQLLMRSLAVVLLLWQDKAANPDTNYFAVYFAADMALFLIQKILRNDFYCKTTSEHVSEGRARASDERERATSASASER
jgi:hypothetical protein